MQEIKVSELKPHPKNDFFFDDMDGERWTEFLESVKTSGVIEPVIITQNKTIVSGHQRVRACIEIGIKSVLCEMRDYKDGDAVIKELLETNIRQRGDVGGSMRKQGLRNKELERLYGVREGSSGKVSLESEFTTPKVGDLARQTGQSRDEWFNAKKLAEAIPELDDFIKTGVMSTTTAIAIAKKLSLEEQEELLSSLPASEKLTQKQMQEYMNKVTDKDKTIAEYQTKLKLASSEQSKKYQDQISNLNIQIELKDKKITTYEEQKKMLERKATLNNEEAEKYKKLKSDIEFMTQQKNDISRKISSATELSALTVQLQNVLEKDLAPIKFKRCIEVLDKSDVARNNLIDIIDLVENWVNEMKPYLNSENTINVNYTEILGGF